MIGHSILLSLSPAVCERIINGKQKVVVSRKAPELTPFKVYIYCTRPQIKRELVLCKSEENVKLFGENAVVGMNKGGRRPEDELLYGKVIGEFVCNERRKYSCKLIPRRNLGLGYNDPDLRSGLFLLNENDSFYTIFEQQGRVVDSLLTNPDIIGMRETPKALYKLAGGLNKSFCTLAVSDIKVYSNPKSVSDFKKAGHCALYDSDFCKTVCRSNQRDDFGGVNCKKDKRGETVNCPPRGIIYVEEI